MRIALDATYSVDPRPSGIAVYSRELLVRLPEQYPKHRFLQCYRPKQWWALRRRGGENVRAEQPEVRLLVPPLPTFRADVFHALNQRVDRRPARIVISTFHDLFVMTGEYSTVDFRARFTEQARRAAARSDFIIAVSEFTARQITDLLGFDRSRIRVVPHGVVQVKSETQLPATKMVLFVGALQIRKNVGRLVRAMEQLPSDWRLVLAGSPTGYGAARILEEIAASPSRSRIQVAGYVSTAELYRLYSEASIFAFPSLDEGFGMPILDAMAHGVPVVTSNRSGLTEVAGDAALLVNPDNTDEIAWALNRLVADEDLRRQLTLKGRSRAQIYTWDRTVQETFNVYEEAHGL